MTKISKELQSLSERIDGKREIYNQFVADSLSDVSIPYASFDIRNAEFKVAHVDANLFSAGFNLLSEDAKKLAAEQFTKVVGSNQKIVLYPENFSRNDRYFENLSQLRRIIEKSGAEVRIAHESPLNEDFARLELTDHGRAAIGAWQADLIILNNDLSEGPGDFIRSVKTPIIPDYRLGWYNRLKSTHFMMVDEVLEELSGMLEFDPWLMSAIHCNEEEIDFRESDSLSRLAEAVAQVRQQIADKYKLYGINQDPHVYIKSDFGTFGMGMMVVKDPQEVLTINKKLRNKMDAVKGGVKNSKIHIQEAVPTRQTIKGHTAETMAYVVNKKIVDLILRANEEKDALANLNSKGMYFERHTCKPCRIYEICVDIALCAIAREIRAIKN